MLNLLDSLIFTACPRRSKYLDAGRHSDSVPDGRRVPLCVHDNRVFRTVLAALQTGTAVGGIQYTPLVVSSGSGEREHTALGGYLRPCFIAVQLHIYSSCALPAVSGPKGCASQTTNVCKFWRIFLGLQHLCDTMNYFIRRLLWEPQLQPLSIKQSI